MSVYSVSDVVNMTGRDLGTSNATQAVSIESGSVAITGAVTTVSSKLKASYSASVTATYPITGNYIEIDNQGLETITLSVNSISIPVKQGYIFSASFADFTTFTITVPTTCNHQILVGA